MWNQWNWSYDTACDKHIIIDVLITCTSSSHARPHACPHHMHVLTHGRNYKRLNVRYARLRQTPVRFSFTQAGEMVEEDDYEGAPFDDDDEEETNIQT